MRLAGHLGWSLQDIRRYMTCREVQEWRAYNEIEPFGEERADLRAAIIARTVAAYLTGHNFKIADFMPDFDIKNQAQTEDEMLGRLKLAVKIAEAKKGESNGQPDGSCRIADRKDG